MDRIYLHKIRVNALVGELPHERIRRQALLIDLKIELDLHPAAESDDLTRSVDYAEIERRAVEIAENSSFHLQEALAGAIGKMIMSYEPVCGCCVTLTKPAGSSAGSGAGVELEFSR